MATQRESSSAPADNYFGSVAGSLADRFMWVWMNQRLRVQHGTDHGKDQAWQGQDLEACYRGWYDPTSDEVFLVGPRPAEGRQPVKTRRIPRILDRALRGRFGDGFTYRVF